jgi:hypothetical protein
MKDQDAKDTKKSRFAAKQAKQKMIRDLRNHPMLAPLITFAIIVAHLFTFRQFSFALIEVQKVKDQIASQPEESDIAPVVYEPTFFESVSTTESR